MTDTNSEGSGQEQPQEGQQDQKTFDAEYVEKLRKENAKYRTEAKANAEAAKRLADLEESQKSEAQKQAERIAALEDEVNTTRASALRAQFSADVPDQLRPLITGSTEEELKAQRDAVLSYVSEQQKHGNVVPRAGITPQHAGSGDDMAFANFLTGNG